MHDIKKQRLIIHIKAKEQMKNVDYTVLVLVLGCKTKVIYCFILKNKIFFFLYKSSYNCIFFYVENEQVAILFHLKKSLNKSCIFLLVKILLASEVVTIGCTLLYLFLFVLYCY